MKQLLFSITINVLLSYTLAAQWTHTNGPYGGTVKSLVAVSSGADSTILLAGTGGDGVFCSTDSGMHRTPANSGLTYKWINCLELQHFMVKKDKNALPREAWFHLASRDCHVNLQERNS